jgi:hypothetical protein
MLETIAIVLIILWLAGFSFGLLGGYIHLLLILAVILFLIRIIRGPSVAGGRWFGF